MTSASSIGTLREEEYAFRLYTAHINISDTTHCCSFLNFKCPTQTPCVPSHTFQGQGLWIRWSVCTVPGAPQPRGHLPSGAETLQPCGIRKRRRCEEIEANENVMLARQNLGDKQDGNSSSLHITPP
jgi:hypothetical protein